MCVSIAVYLMGSVGLQPLIHWKCSPNCLYHYGPLVGQLGVDWHSSDEGNGIRQSIFCTDVITCPSCKTNKTSRSAVCFPKKAESPTKENHTFSLIVSSQIHEVSMQQSSHFIWCCLVLLQADVPSRQNSTSAGPHHACPHQFVEAIIIDPGMPPTVHFELLVSQQHLAL